MGIRTEINKRINDRLKASLTNVKVRNTPDGVARAQLIKSLSFFYEGSRCEEPEEVNSEEGFQQKQTLYYRCSLKTVTATGVDAGAEILDRIQDAVIGYQVLPEAVGDEGFLFLVSDDSDQLENGTLLYSIVIGVNHYHLVFPCK